MPHLGDSRLETERVAHEIHVEQRAYMEEVETAVAETVAASTELELRMMQLGSRSVESTIELADRQIRGRITHVSGEIASIQTIGGAVFIVRISQVMSIRYLDTPGETRGIDTGYPSTMIAKLRELWNTGERCTIGRVMGPAILGDIVAVTEGHVECVDPQFTNWLIPASSIAWVGPKL